MHISLAGKSAIVTGGSKGIGLAIATSFIKAGAEVAIVARDPHGLDAAVGAFGVDERARITTIAADVSTAGGIEHGWREAIRAFGKIDIVVNNAGTSQAGPFEDMTDELLQQDLELKLFAAVRLARLAWPQMKARRWGRVLNVLSIAAKAPAARSAPTSLSRAAGMALTKVLANEGAPHGILVNALLVGMFQSAQFARRADRAGLSSDALAEQLGRDLPLGRVGQPHELANLACLLASDAGSYITGAAINVDGGRSPVV